MAVVEVERMLTLVPLPGPSLDEIAPQGCQ